MNEIEAHSWLAKYIGYYRSRSYQYLATFARLGGTDSAKVAGLGGGEYRIEIQVRCDEDIGGSVQVMASISDGSNLEGLSLTESFVVQPTGEFAEA